MRWDYGQIFKEIRKSKGLTQQDVCGQVIHRTTLTNIEHGKVIPSFENMVFLLEQIDMSLAEFKYICNEYHPSKRRDIIVESQNPSTFQDTRKMVELTEKCQKYLKTHHDVPIQNIYRHTKIVTELRTKGFKNNHVLKDLYEEIWDYLESMDTWYISDLKLLGTILFFFPSENLPLLIDRIMKTIEKYKYFRETKAFLSSFLANLSTVYFQHHLFKECETITLQLLVLAEELKIYDILGFSQVRLGILQHNSDLIDKGITLLRLTKEEALVKILEKEINDFSNL
ncbi:TPA: Rgg/GadR/MutR family transcriptional regulator Rgg1518 [Streptococcus pneumoniae]|nr:helix-turn-helix domain-containing protein [Streptococcus pneumoniae]